MRKKRRNGSAEIKKGSTLTMRKICVENYNVSQNGKEEPFLVKTSLCNLLFQPGLRLNFRELLKNEAVAVKIESCPDGFVFLLPDEYDRLKRAIETYDTFDRFSVELVRRVEEAEEVAVEVKEK